MNVTSATAASGIGRNWGWMLAYGVLLIVLGYFAMWHPLVTGLAMGVILAISLAIGGVGALVAMFRDAGWRARTVDMLFGVLMLLGAFVCMADPFGGAVSIVWMIGVIFLIMGGYEFAAGFRSHHERVWLILLGMVDMLFGFWATFMMPADAALVALSALVGIVFAFRGALLVALAFKLRGLAR